MREIRFKQKGNLLLRRLPASEHPLIASVAERVDLHAR